MQNSSKNQIDFLENLLEKLDANKDNFKKKQ